MDLVPKIVGTMATSRSFSFGMITSRQPASMAAWSLGRTPPIAKHFAHDRDLAGHGDVVADGPTSESRDDPGDDA